MNLRGKLSTFFSLNALIWLAMFVALAALLSLAAAAWLALAPLVGPALAALFTGLALLVVAAILSLWLARSGRSDAHRHDEPAPPPSRSELTLEESLRPLIGDQALEWTKRNSGLVMIGAFAAGVVIAASPGARRALTRTAGPMVTRKALDVWQSFNGED